jgi:hypothetical protein
LTASQVKMAAELDPKVVRNFNEAIATFTSLKAVDSVTGAAAGSDDGSTLGHLPPPSPIPLRQLHQVSNFEFA